jgi:hypothetical protein
MSSRPCDVDLPSDAVQFTKRALEMYYDSDPANESVLFSPKATWNDVFESARLARQEDQKGSIVDRLKQARVSYDSKGRLHRIGRKFGDIAPAIVHKLDYAPDEMYIGVVCQGLKFVFDVSLTRL